MTLPDDRRRNELQAELLEVEQCRERMANRREKYAALGHRNEVEFYNDMVDDLDHRVADIMREVGRE